MTVENDSIINACPFCGEESLATNPDSILIQFSGATEYIYSAHKECIEKLTGKNNEHRKQA